MKAYALVILCASLVLAGCAAVRIVPAPDLGKVERLNLTVGLLVPKAEARRSTHSGGKTFKTGDALKVGAINTFKQVVTDLVELKTREQASTTPYLMMLLQPRVVSFDYDPNGHASVTLGCRMTDPKDRIYMDSTWIGTSSASVDEQSGAAGNAKTGKWTAEGLCSEAFEAALSQMASSFVRATRQTSFR